MVTSPTTTFIHVTDTVVGTQCHYNTSCHYRPMTYFMQTFQLAGDSTQTFVFFRSVEKSTITTRKLWTSYFVITCKDTNTWNNYMQLIISSSDVWHQICYSGHSGQYFFTVHLLMWLLVLSAECSHGCVVWLWTVAIVNDGHLFIDKSWLLVEYPTSVLAL